jgi:hypothetical protein
MKVFKMNDYDWVYAESADQAKELYKKETGFDMDEIEEDFEGEVSLDDTMLIDIDDLPTEELNQPQTMQHWAGSNWAVKPFSWVIEHQNITKSCIICSTEY